MPGRRSLALLPLLLPPLAGCSVATPPLRLYDGQDVVPRAQASVGVSLLADERPEEERVGTKPMVVPLLIWNQRIGDWVTSEDMFIDGVSDAVTRGVAEALDGGSFGRARVLDASASPSESPEDRCRAAGVRFLATGTIHELYATLHQRAYFALLPTPWVAGVMYDNKKSDPLGVASVDLSITDCEKGAEVAHIALAAERRFPRATLPQAAKLALQEMLDQLHEKTHRPPDFYDLSPSTTHRAPPDLVPDRDELEPL